MRPSRFYLLLTRRVSLTRQAGLLTVQLHGGGGMDQELVQYLDERFHYLDERFNRVDQRFDRVEQQLDAHDQRFDSIDQRFNRIEQRLDGHDQRFLSLDQRFEEVKRHTGVLVEGLRHELHLVAEGLTMHIEDKVQLMPEIGRAHV